MEIRKGAMAIIFIRNPLRILVVKNPKSGQYSFLAGGSKENESCLDTALREIKEEISLELTKNKIAETDLFYEYIFTSWKTKEQVLGRQRVFLVEIDAKDLSKIHPKDVLEVLWLSEKDVKAKLAERKGLLELLERVRAFIQ